MAGRIPQFNRDELHKILAKLWMEGNRRPSYPVCVDAGFLGGKDYFKRLKNAWLRERGITPKPRGMSGGRSPKDRDAEVKERLAEVNKIKPRGLTPETKLAGGRPIEPIEELTMSQRAIREYNVASRRVGLSRARAK